MDYASLVYLSAVVFLGTISLIAVLIPAMRRARVDPIEALRYE